MDFLKYYIITIASVYIFVFLILAARSKKALKLLLFNAISGISLFLLLYFTKNFTGIFLCLNPCTFSVSSIFGIPGVITILFFNFII